MDRRCVVCGGDTKASSNYNDGTLMDSSEDCAACGYVHEYSCGDSAERIGWWAVLRTHNEAAGEVRKLDNARTVALIVRWYELGLIPDAQKGFAAALAADPSDFTAAKVYADWLDEYGPDDQTTKWTAYRLRDYDDPVGFPTPAEQLKAAIKRFESTMAPIERLMGGS